jgi:hypothetical protein
MFRPRLAAIFRWFHSVGLQEARREGGGMKLAEHIFIWKRESEPFMEGHPLSAVHSCLFSVFTATLHSWRPFPPSAIQGRTMLRWQGTRLTWKDTKIEALISVFLPFFSPEKWCVPNSLIRRDLSCPTVKEEIRRYSSHYGDRLRIHPNHLVENLLRLPDNRHLRRFLPTDLPDRF